MALKKKLDDFNSALNRLEEAYNKAIAFENSSEYSFFRDSTIQRFEFTLEIGWKSIKTYLFEEEGIECRSPKSCVREFFTAGFMEEKDVSEFLAMIDDRNLATHTYHESLAQEIFQRIGNYLPLLKEIFKKLL